MRVLFTLLLFITVGLKVSAEIATLQFTETQYQAVLDMRMATNQPDSILLQSAIPVFKGWKAEDIKHVLSMLMPANQKAYLEKPEIYQVCGSISAQLIQAELTDINFAALLKNRKSEHLQNNLQVFFQNQLFDFFYNNDLTDYLKQKEYIDVMMPQAVFKLMKDFRTEEKLYEEIRFITANSDYLLFNGVQP